jgi:TolB-like protein/class 3 adenylate cyclase
VDRLGSLDSFIFEGFRFDPAAGGLFRTTGSGVTEPVALGSRALALLALFVERPGQLVSKDDIFAVAWSGTVVGENNLTVQISALRRVLDDARSGRSCVQTVAGRGYRFVLPVTRRKMSTTRRLAAILAADVAGYSRLIGTDEPGTLARLKTIRSELIDPSIASHNGRIVKTTGDGLLAEFVSSVDALNCAQETRVGLGKLNAELTPDNRIELRIGIHQGDIVVEDGDIFGDGVNIAARLEGLAEPGGICVSARVQEDAAGKLDLVFRDLGEQRLHNIVRPVRAYTVDADAHSATQIISDDGGRSRRLSIVVLPFANLNNDREQQYLADAITEYLTTDLSRIDDMLVISRTTASTYRDKRVSAPVIGRELNVRYVLEGGVHRSLDRIRVNAQLIDAETDAHVWAERFDYRTDDVFTLQDEVTGKIAIALGTEIVRAEAARPTSNPGAVDYVLRARAALDQARTPERLALAIDCLEQALAIDPQTVDTRVLLAIALIDRVLEQRTDAAGADIERAERLIEQALRASPGHAVAHFARGQLLRAQGQYETAIPEYEAAIAANPNWVAAIANIGLCKFFTGDIEGAIPAQELAIRLSPRDWRLPNWYWRIGIVHLLQSRIDTAILWLEKARTANPRLPGPHAWLASAYGLKGEMDRAAVELAKARHLGRDNRYDSIARYRSSWPESRIDELAQPTFLAGLRKAGMPEE